MAHASTHNTFLDIFTLFGDCNTEKAFLIHKNSNNTRAIINLKSQSVQILNAKLTKLYNPIVPKSIFKFSQRNFVISQIRVQRSFFAKNISNIHMF